MIFQALAPSTGVFAQELDAVMEASVSAARAAGNTARSVQDAVTSALQDADQATSDDAATTPGADAGATEGGDGSTNAGESQDSTTDGTANGDASTEGDASQDDAATDEGAADEEQADDADADAADQAGVTYEYNTVEDLKKAIGGSKVAAEGDKATQVTIETSEDLIKLSNANPVIYQDAAITKGSGTGTGEFNLCGTVTAADGAVLSFLGLGAQNTPFKGSFGLGTTPVVLNRPLFNSVELSADVTLKLTWKGTTSDPVVATTIAGGGHKLTVDLTVAPSADNTTAVTLTSPLLGSVSGVLVLDASYAAKGGATPAVNIQSKTDNIGLLANTLADAANLSIEKLTLPNAYSGSPTIQTTKVAACAGGLIGVCGNGATVSINGNVDLSSFSVIGKAASGGLIGKATSLTLDIANDATIKPARSVGDENSACSGGVIGDVSFAQGFIVKSNMFDLGDGVALGATQRAGALFGIANITNGDIVVQGGTYKSKLASGTDGSTSGSYGGLVGKVFATANSEDGALRAFIVQKDPNQNDADKNKCAIEFNLASGLSDAGGVVGYAGDSALSGSQPVAVVLDGVKVTCRGDASARTGTGKLGGAVGVVDTRSVLDVRDFTLTSDNPIGKAQSNRAAGIAGSAWNAVIKFSGITDLSGASFAENSTTGQLVYENNNALIFAAGDGSNGELTDKGATGWTFKRSKTASKTDDIATCGEVIRLGSNFIELDPDTHMLTLPDSLTPANGVFTLGSVEDFAKLAITWQTNGYYSMVTGVSDSNLNGLQSSIITVNGEIDLAGTGLTGFTQDCASDSQVFSGTLNGSGTINLAVGEPYGKRGEDELGESDASNGNGKIYRHGRLGLFAAVNGAAISNVTIAGSMKFDNQSNVDAGALAGVKVGGDTSLTTVTFSAGIKYESTNGNNYIHVGGVFGGISGAGSLKIGSRELPSVINANIVSEAQESGVSCVGGAVGYVSSDCVPPTAGETVEVGGLTISKSIAIRKGSAKTYASGFIGQIAQGGVDGKTGVLTSVKKIEITKLDFVDFTLETAGPKTTSSGGFLGYSWAGTEVTLGDSVNTNEKSYAITTSGSSVKSTSAKELGGLVYAASGHWIVNDYAIDLSGATIIADKATTLGLLVGRGSRVVDGVYGSESYAGLYLEDRAYWGTAYRVEGVTVEASENIGKFDEWVGDGRKPGSKLIDGEWNAVVSLHTKDDINEGKLDMSGKPESDNSYHNRSDFGKNHNTNAWTRYYYNLDKAYAKVGNNTKNSSASSWMDSPEYLLLWCAYLYAPPASQAYIIPGNQEIFKGNNIGTDDAEGVAIDLKGYSFYPSNPVGVNKSAVTVKNATIKFHYSDIKAEQEGNKKNNEATQHENMHCGLIRTIANRDLTVSDVTLSGTVGRAKNDRAKGSDPESVSGALVIRCAYADSGKKTATIKIDTLTLDGLQVDGAEDGQYAPLLINAITRYVNLDVKNVTTTNYAGTSGVNKIAASSMFGRLGYDNSSNQVTAKFEQIGLPSQTGNSIFTHASLLESFGYANTGTGSADYTFTKADADAGKVTYGSEIDAKDKEYSGKQLWYYDEATYGTDNGLVTVGGKTANVDTPQFGDYLPYVYKGKATEGNVQYHEIKVNQRLPKLLTGCGTYGDPYAVKDATEMNAIANYINNGTALDGWEVTIAADQAKLCERRGDETKTDNEVVYVYKQSNPSESKWEKKVGEKTDSTQTLKDETMRRYIQSAYYSIEPVKENKITIDAASFGGFGNKANPFRGVIVGNLGNSTATIEIENNKGELRGLIPYSYGSVVHNLNIRYVDAQATITYSAKDTDGVPTAFFGGVIGCILGGDNIIDGVVVNGTTDNPATGFTVAGGGTKPHLVPIGGYVGAIAGGGVIFRHMTGASWRAGTSDKSRGLGKGNFDLYNNPYVGRVIDGYAFSEGCAVENGDANYKINELTNEPADNPRCIATGDIRGCYRGNGNNKTAVTTTVNNGQGLLVLSAIISSGAAGGSANASTTAGAYGTPAGSRAYLGGNKADGTYQFGNQQYGKVRNASYASVGKPKSASGDFAVAINDDTKSPGIQEGVSALDYTGDGSDVNSPYLVRKYATWQTGYICATQVSGMDLQFANTTFDMTGFGSGFTGLSGRYYSNACASSSGADRDRIVPLVACINGDGATIKVKNNTQEYTDDDFCVAGVGGLFNTVTFYSSRYNSESIKANDSANVRNISFEGCDISLSYKNKAGGEVSNSLSVDNTRVGAGCFAGATANEGVYEGVYKNVHVLNGKVRGAWNAAGLVGTSGYMVRGVSGDTGSIANLRGAIKSPVQLTDCSYQGLSVEAYSYAGGFAGKIVSGTSGLWVTSDATVAQGSTITILDNKKKAADGTNAVDGTCVAGGIFALAGGAVYVNTGQAQKAAQVATIQDVIIKVNRQTGGIGGVVGQVLNSPTEANRIKITATKESSGDDAVYFGYLSASGDMDGLATTAGGIVGYSNNQVTCNSCTVEKIRMAVAGNAGGLIGSPTLGQTIKCSNTIVRGLTFDGSNSGCISGEGKGKFHLANVLLDSNTFNNKDQGILLGNVDTNNLGGYELYAAGVSVKLGKGQTNADMPALIRASDSRKIGEVNKKSYVAFGDYSASPAPPSDGMTLYGADATDSTTAAVDPCVTTSPVSSLSIKTASDETGQTRHLFGDGVNVSGAWDIKTDTEKGSDAHYTYTNIGGIDKDGVYQNTSKYSKSCAKFNENNDTDATQSDANPDVLVLSGNDSDTVKDYLNIVTNGGYSDALRLNADGSHVSATVDVFQLENGVFVKQSDVTDKALDVKGSGSSLSIGANSNWDNGKGRFNLLTVTFTEAGQSYRVMVPIIVKRVLEINFTATYSEGSNFNSDDYSSKYDKHVLISSGEVMTGYLTWTYNKAYDQKTEYGWNTHLASGGDMRPLNKRIVFGGERGVLPAGTQLTLVDTAHNNKEYHYTVPAGGPITSVALTDFEDSSENHCHYTEQWLSETMGATATEADNGTWVKLTNKELTDEKNVKKTEAELAGIAGAKIGNDYYRVKTDADKKPFYSLTVPKQEADEQPKSESFYLVVRTPKNSANVNGYTGTSVKTSVNTHLNYTLRDKDETKDSHENTASTYSVATNFQHNLVDNKSGTNQMTVKGTTYPLDMDVSDTITFGEQEYTGSDELYYQLDSSLVNYENHSAAGAHGYPTGTQGTYSFYVMVGKDYYAPHASTENGKTKWTWEKTTAEDPCAATAPWAADGADMKLTLADAKLGAIDLSGIREIAKSHGKQFTITMKANLTMTEPACQAGIIASQKGDGDKYTKPNYRAYLSTDSDTLSTSSNSAYNDGGAGYYRMDVGSSTIALEASKKSQLGINIDDLKSDDGEIALVGTYDFSKLAGADAMISSANKVTYALSLQQRQDTGKYAEVSDISKYITVLGSDKLGAGSLSGNSYVFTDNKTGGKFATLDDNSLAFTHAFRVKVNTDVEGKSQKTYANYRLVLTANMTGGGVNDTPVNVSNLADYARSDYVTYTLARINTGGIPHETETN